MTATSVRWSDLWVSTIRDPRRFRILSATIPLLAAIAVLAAPVLSLVVVATIALATLLWRSEHATALLLIALGCSVKFHYYTGLVTLFPEYLVIALAVALGIARWLEGDRGVGEGRMAALFAWLIFAGLLSAVNAINLTRVGTKEILLVIDAAIFFLIVRGLRTFPEIRRGLCWLEWTAAVVAIYGFLQFVSPFFGWDLSFSFLRKYSNPHMYLGIGPPVIWEFSKTFRANAFFNDPNILGGYLAASMSVILALCLHHAETARRARASAEAILLFALGVLLLMTLSRSGMLALIGGFAAVIFFMPGILLRTAFWIFSGIATVTAGLISAWLGVDSLLLLVRLGMTFNRDDLSNRVHFGVAEYAIDLLRRFPITGAGLNNFGYYYSGEVDAKAPGMMSHSAYLSFFSETGILGGLAFLAIVLAILARPWRALRDPALRRESPQLRAWLVGLFAAMVALAVGNVFYDYYLRTFVWVFGGMAVAAARLWERRAAAK